MDTLLRLPNRQAQAVAQTLEQPLPDSELLEHQNLQVGILAALPFVSQVIQDSSWGHTVVGITLVEYRRFPSIVIFTSRSLRIFMNSQLVNWLS